MYVNIEDPDESTAEVVRESQELKELREHKAADISSPAPKMFLGSK